MNNEEIKEETTELAKDVVVDTSGMSFIKRLTTLFRFLLRLLTVPSFKKILNTWHFQFCYCMSS